MDKRSSFILHFDSLDVFEELSKEQIADLFIAIRDYNLWKDVNLSWLMKAVFIPFKNQFDRDLEKYKDRCEINKNNGKKWWRPKIVEENPVGYLETQENQSKPKKPYNDSDSDSKTDNNNKLIIISKDITEQSSELSIINNNTELKINKSNIEINNMQELIKNTILSLWLIYKAWRYERQRIQNILTAKDFWEICDKAKMTREQFAINIINLSAKLDFWKWKIYNWETFYKHYASVYNEAVRIKTEAVPKTAWVWRV